MADPSKKKSKLKVNPKLDGLDINIDSFGVIKSNFSVDQINSFLDKTVNDKKLKEKGTGKS